MKRFNTFLFLCLILAGCGEPADPNQLLETDRDFSAMSVNKGWAAAFIAYADDSAMVLQNNQPTISGIDQITNFYQGLPDDKSALEWFPIRAELARSGDLGYTYGEYTFTRLDTVITGRYISIWKRQRDGSWKYVVDIGVDG